MTSARLALSLQKLARRITNPKLQPPLPSARFYTGTVTAVTGGGALAKIGDASPTVNAVTVQIGSSTVVAPYLAAYSSPVVGDSVCVVLYAGQARVLGRLTGFPVF